MKAAAKKQSKKTPSYQEEEALRHDKLVLATIEKLVLVALQLDRMALITYKPEECNIGLLLEYEMPSGAGFDCFADIAITLDGVPVALLEIKSEREGKKGTASEWFRQIRRYRKLTGLPCVLIIDHDLESYMDAYLRLAKVDTIDLRTL